LAQRLLEKESVTLDDLNEILGPRPFKAKSNFQKFLDFKYDERYKGIN